MVKVFSPGCGNCRGTCLPCNCIPDLLCLTVNGYSCAGASSPCEQTFPILVPRTTSFGTYSVTVPCDNNPDQVVVYTLTCAAHLGAGRMSLTIRSLSISGSVIWEVGQGSTTDPDYGTIDDCNPFAVTFPVGTLGDVGAFGPEPYCGASGYVEANWSVDISGYPCAESFMPAAAKLDELTTALPVARPEKCLHLGARTEFRTGCGGFNCFHVCELGHTEDPMQGVGLVRPGGYCQTCPDYAADGGAF